MIWVGTSGYNYPEWKGSFYPSDLAAAKMLPYYGARFPTVEINYTFYRMPTEKLVAGWAAQTPTPYQLTLKAPRRITHDSRLKDAGDSVARFCEVATTLGDKLGTLLFQLPPFLRKDLALLDAFLPQLPAGTRAAFEFRHDSWFDDDIFNLLKSRNIALCIADTDTIATPRKITSDYGYLRLRRADYQATDIERWAEFARQQESHWKDAFVYFKHEESGIGPKLAQQMLKLLA